MAIFPSRVHFVSLAGIRENPPNYRNVHSTVKKAAEALRIMYSLSDRDARTLESAQHLSVDTGIHGIWYAEIEECHCDEPARHLD